MKRFLLLIAFLIVSVPGLAQRTGNPGTGGAIGQGVLPVTALPTLCTAVGSGSSSSPVRYQGNVYICSATNTWTQVGTGGGSISGLTATRVAVAASATTLTGYAGLTVDGSGNLTAPNLTSSALTSGRVPFATTGGLLTNDSAFSWDNINKRLAIGVVSAATSLYIYQTTAGATVESIGASSFASLAIKSNTSPAGYWGILTGGSGAIVAKSSFTIYDYIGTTHRLTIDSAGLVGINQPASIGAQFQVTSSGAAVIGQIIKGAAGQSANLQEWQNSAGTVVASVTSSGGVVSTTTVTGSEIRASTYYFGFGSSGQRGWLFSPSDGVTTLYNSATTDFSRLQFGGTTSSFPSLKRNTTYLEVRLADDSAYADIVAKYGRFGGVSASGVITAGGASTGGAYYSVSTSSQVANDSILIGVMSGAITGLLYGNNFSVSATTGFANKYVNTENATNTSHTYFQLVTGGSSGGDPYINFQVSGTNDWSLGAKNSDTQALYFVPSSTLGGASNVLAIAQTGKFTFPSTITAGGTTGNQTINKISGTVNIAAAGTTVTVTNSFVTTSSIVFTSVRTNDATCSVKNAVPGSGSVVITMTAACTGETSVAFWVIN